MKIINRGAEAVLGLEDGKIVKERIKKSYRVPELDQAIRKQRTSMEASMLNKARRAGIAVPLVLGQEGSTLFLELIEGKTVKDVLNGLDKKEAGRLARKIGPAVAKLHSAGIMHGDLTTSNMLIKGENIYIIDFGLSKSSSRIEDQATDLYLLFEALQSTHSQVLEAIWPEILEAYKKSFAKSAEVLERLEEVSKRRRYKTDS